MYVYFINFLDYGDSSYYPIFSFKKYNLKEFEELCIKAFNKVCDEKFFGNEIITNDVCRLIRDNLCEEENFFKSDIIGFNLNDKECIYYNYL